MDIMTGTLANVFDVAKSEKMKNTATGRISTYEGKDMDGNAKFSSWNARFVGDAYKKAAKLKDKERIQILKGKVENRYDKEAKKTYITVTVFDFGPAPEKEKKEDPAW